jgi:hypothetical protein
MRVLLKQTACSPDFSQGRFFEALLMRSIPAVLKGKFVKSETMQLCGTRKPPVLEQSSYSLVRLLNYLYLKGIVHLHINWSFLHWIGQSIANLAGF